MSAESLKECFNDACFAQGENKAIIFLRDGEIETEISYLDLNQDSNRLAHTFRDKGVEKGDRVILFIRKSVIFVVPTLHFKRSVPLPYH